MLTSPLPSEAQNPGGRFEEIEILGNMAWRRPRPGVASAALIARDAAEREALAAELAGHEESRKAAEDAGVPSMLGATFVEDVEASFARFEAEGVRAVLLTLASMGGLSRAADAMCEAIGRFQRAGGKVIAFVRVANSAAVQLAVGCDVVIVHPHGGFGIHAPLMWSDAPGAEERRREIMAADLERLAARTATPREDLAEWLSVGADAETMTMMLLGAAPAVCHGFADTIGGRDVARRIASLMAAGSPLPSLRAAMLARRAAGRADAAEAFSGRPAPVRHTYPRPRAWTSRVGEDARCNGVASTHLASKPDRRELHEMAAKNWTAQTAPAASYKDVAWNGSRLVVVGDGGAGATSLNGIDWTAITLPGGADYFDVLWNGSKFIATGFDGAAAYSSDGITWSAGSMPNADDRFALAWNGSLHVAMGNSLAVSSNGQTWSAWPKPDGIVQDVAWNGSLFVAVGSRLSPPWPLCITSPDGYTWTERTLPGTLGYYAVGWTGAAFVAAGPAGWVATSPDGLEWTQRTLTTVPGTHSYNSIAASGRLVLMLDGSVSAGYPSVAATSTDHGATWKVHTTGIRSLPYYGLVWADSMFVAVSPSGIVTSGIVSG